MDKLQDGALLGLLGNGQDIDIIPRCESSLSSASKSSNYTEELGEEDLTRDISLILDEDLESLNHRPPDTTGVSRKREHDFSFNVDNGLPRQRLKYTHLSNDFSSFPSPHDLSASTPHLQWQPPKPVIVGASSAVQKYTSRLPWGTLWELARLIATGLDPLALDDILGELLEPRPRMAASVECPSSNADTAPRVAKIAQRLKKVDRVEGHISDEFSAVYAGENSTKLPWDELDKEEKILGCDPLGGIGGNCAEAYSKQEHDWYGGNVNFTAHLNRCKPSDSLRLTLERPVLGPSNRFARRFGSRRFIRVRVASELVYSQRSGELAAFFKRPLVIGSATFRAFFAKEYSVFFFRTHEELVGSEEHRPIVRDLPLTSNRARQEHSLLEFLRWHNEMDLNYEQTMVKWAAHFALGLSNSVPSLRLQSTNIIFMEDIICEAFIGAGKPPSEMVMTDGCGLANRTLMRTVREKLGWQDEPPAIQMRIGGAKGLLLVLHGLPPELEQQPTVWLRPSQLKINYQPHTLVGDAPVLPPDADPALLTLDVLRTARMNTPARLFAETITNLADNGVPNMYFETLFKTALTERVDRFLRYSLDDRADAPLLFEACAREGGVFNARLAREAPGRARSSGYVAEDYDAPDEDDEDEDRLGRALREQSSAWWPDPVSGLPSGLAETCMVLLGAGFVPATCGVLKEKLGEVVRSAVRSFKTKYRFAVPMSCSALVVPDPFGVLGPNEIHVKCSRRDFVDQEGVKTDQIVGDVLVTRHPCKVPSDVQKVKAVLHEKLRNYCDVIVVSTRSHMYKNVSLDRHLASLTAGGDYDGDTMEVFWDPQLVEPFQQPNPHLYANEPPEIQQSLNKNTETVSAFLSRVPPDAPEEYQIFGLQDYLLGALKGRSFVSTYSIWWEKSAYEKGYRHKDTVFLAYMFCAALDGLKTGVSVDPDVYKLHSKTWNGKDPLQWKSLGKDPPVRSLKRDHKCGEFVMDSLLRCVHRECREQLRRIDEWIPADRMFFGKWGARDEDLARPWLMALKNADTLRKSGHTAKWDALQRIQSHVEEVYPKFQGKFGGSAAGSFTSLPIEERQDMLRAESRMFHSQPTELLALDDPTTIKTSCMYVYAYEQGGRGRSRIPWDVAAGTLCEIKAKARGRPQVFASDMGPWMELNKAFLRHTRKISEDARK